MACSGVTWHLICQPQADVLCLSAFEKPGGTILLSTISRTALAYLLTIAIAGSSISQPASTLEFPPAEPSC